MIVMYDLEDNLITIFDSYKDCAKYFNTNLSTIYSSVCRIKSGKLDKKRDVQNKRWVRLYKMVEDDD